jgi:3-keto-5-aminohexanoate cleavage enzyme
VHDETPLIIEVRCNESADRGDNPALPYGPQEVVEELLLAREAGASILHWHARDYEGRERADDVTLYREVIDGIREHADDALLHPTLGFIATQGDAQGRVRHILELNENPKTRIDMVPVDFGSFGADLWDERDGLFLTDDQFVVNRVAYLKELLGVLKENGLYVYSVVWSAGAVRTARSLQKMGLLDRTTFWCLGFTGDEVPGGPPPTPANLSTFLEAIPPGDPWTVHCRNGDALPLAAWAITQGGHVSIGLGDYPYSRFGKPRNSDLVGMVADMARTLGRPVATPDQAREILRVDQLAGTASPARARASSDGRTQSARHRG